MSLDSKTSQKKDQNSEVYTAQISKEPNKLSHLQKKINV